MAKKKTTSKTTSKTEDGQSHVSFEAALGELERIVGQLEDGDLGLDDALAHYENGIRHLKHCYRLLEGAERKIQLLQGVDAEGNIQAESFDEAETSLEEKAQARGRRRTSSRTDGSGPPSRRDNNVDAPRGLF